MNVMEHFKEGGWGMYPILLLLILTEFAILRPHQLLSSQVRLVSSSKGASGVEVKLLFRTSPQTLKE